MILDTEEAKKSFLFEYKDRIFVEKNQCVAHNEEFVMQEAIDCIFMSNKDYCILKTNFNDVLR